MDKALTGEGTTAMTASFKVFMEQQWLRQQALHANVDSSGDDDLALMETEDGQDGFTPQTKMKKRADAEQGKLQER